MNKYFQIGSIKTGFRMLAIFSWHNIRRFGNLSLVGWKGVKQVLHCLINFNWVKLLTAVDLIIKIAQKIHSILFYNEIQMSLTIWDKNIVCCIKNQPYF